MTTPQATSPQPNGSSSQSLVPPRPWTTESPPLPSSLVVQLRDTLERQALEPSVAAEISHLLKDLDRLHQRDMVWAWVQAALTPEGEARQNREGPPDTPTTEAALQLLIDQMRQTMATAPLSKAVQVELSRLFTLLPAVRQRPEVLPEFELAIAALLTPDPKPGRRNLLFVRCLRRELAIKLGQHPNPLACLLLRTSGTPHHRLLSGLTWFLMLFAAVPATLSVLFFTSGVRYQYLEINELYDSLKTYEGELATSQARSGFLETQINSAQALLTPLEPLMAQEEASLAQQQNLLEELQTGLQTQKDLLADLSRQTAQGQKTPPLEVSSANPAPGLTESTPSVPPSVPPSTPIPSTPTDQAIPWAELTTNQQRAIAISQDLATLKTTLIQALEEHNATLHRTRTLMDNALTSQTFSAPTPNQGKTSSTIAISRSVSSTSNTAPYPWSGTAETWEQMLQRQVILALDGILRGIDTIDVPLILAVVSAGALGSFVSVIVRASDFIERQQHTHLDLFLVGFFRPVVGMAFAVFLMAALESGVVSGLLTTDSPKAAQKIYFFIAISFVAGFSERLVKDIMGKTEGWVGGNDPS